MWIFLYFIRQVRWFWTACRPSLKFPRRKWCSTWRRLVMWFPHLSRWRSSGRSIAGRRSQGNSHCCVVLELASHGELRWWISKHMTAGSFILERIAEKKSNPALFWRGTAYDGDWLSAQVARDLELLRARGIGEGSVVLLE